MNKDKVSLFWFRRDLRLEDNHALYRALIADYPVLPIFVFDTNLLSDVSNKKDARVSFIHQQLVSINRLLKSKGSRVSVFHSSPEHAFATLLKEFDIQYVFANRDYEPYARNRDEMIKQLLFARGIGFNTYKDQVIFEPNEILKADHTPYLVYTPYSRKWMASLHEEQFHSYASGLQYDNWKKMHFQEIPPLESIGFSPSDLRFPKKEIIPGCIENYASQRNYPSINGTSRLGIHYRFGTISIRSKAKQAYTAEEKTYLKALIWREFFTSILYFFPRVVQENFNRKYNGLLWRNREEEFELWKKGKTGYPLVDAGMRELNTTGYMHNRVRMLVASFLTKHLLIDWRWGEAYFAEKLLDFDLAANNGNWQWSAGTGVDAQPYFRVFNPTTQIDKFDGNYEYIKKWVPAFGSDKYPKEMVEHKKARERAITAFKMALSQKFPS